MMQLTICTPPPFQDSISTHATVSSNLIVMLANYLYWKALDIDNNTSKCSYCNISTLYLVYVQFMILQMILKNLKYNRQSTVPDPTVQCYSVLGDTRLLLDRQQCWVCHYLAVPEGPQNIKSCKIQYSLDSHNHLYGSSNSGFA